MKIIVSIDALISAVEWRESMIGVWRAFTDLVSAILASLGVSTIPGAPRLAPVALRRLLVDALGLVALSVDLAALPVVTLLGFLSTHTS